MGLEVFDEAISGLLVSDGLKHRCEELVPENLLPPSNDSRHGEARQERG